MNSLRTYNVTYLKPNKFANKKRKCYEDGVMTVSDRIILKDCDGNFVISGPYKGSMALDDNSEFVFKDFEILVCDEISAVVNQNVLNGNQAIPLKGSCNSHLQTFRKPLSSIKYASSSSSSSSSSSFATTISSSSNSSISKHNPSRLAPSVAARPALIEAQTDYHLNKILRSYQQVAHDFLVHLILATLMLVITTASK